MASICTSSRLLVVRGSIVRALTSHAASGAVHMLETSTTEFLLFTSTIIPVVEVGYSRTFVPRFRPHRDFVPGVGYAREVTHKSIGRVLEACAWGVPKKATNLCQNHRLQGSENAHTQPRHTQHRSRALSSPPRFRQHHPMHCWPLPLSLPPLLPPPVKRFGGRGRRYGGRICVAGRGWLKRHSEASGQLATLASSAASNWLHSGGLSYMPSFVSVL